MPIPETLSKSVEQYGLGFIRPRHNEIARRLVCGQKPVEIMKIMGYTAGRFSIIINSPLFKIVVARLSKLRDASTIDIQEELDELQAPALAEVGRIMMTSPSEKLRLDSAKDLLDRGGNVKKGGGIQIDINVHPDPVDLSEYKTKAPVTIDVSSVQPVNDTPGKAIESMKVVGPKLDPDKDNMEALKEICAEMEIEL